MATTKQCQQLNYQFNCQQNHQIIFDNLLKQAIFNVFDNAFECSSDTVSIDIADHQNHIVITTNNAGHFNTKALQNLGKKNISTKHSSGLGLFLTMQILESFNGNLIINNLNNFVEVKIIWQNHRMLMIFCWLLTATLKPKSIIAKPLLYKT